MLLENTVAHNQANKGRRYKIALKLTSNRYILIKSTIDQILSRIYIWKCRYQMEWLMWGGARSILWYGTSLTFSLSISSAVLNWRWRWHMNIYHLKWVDLYSIAISSACIVLENKNSKPIKQNQVRKRLFAIFECETLLVDWMQTLFMCLVCVLYSYVIRLTFFSQLMTFQCSTTC